MITITIESEDGNRTVKKYESNSFEFVPEKIASRQGTAAGIYLPKDAVGKGVIAIILE
jgi:putative transposon-encoded protein